MVNDTFNREVTPLTDGQTAITMDNHPSLRLDLDHRATQFVSHPKSPWIYALSALNQKITLISAQKSGILEVQQTWTPPTDSFPLQGLLFLNEINYAIGLTGAEDLLIFEVNSKTGVLKLNNTYRIGAGGISGVAATQGRFFLAKSNEQSIQSFRLDPVTGVITHLATTPVNASVTSLFIQPNYKHLYAGVYQVNKLLHFAIDPTSSALTAQASIPLDAPATLVAFNAAETSIMIATAANKQIRSFVISDPTIAAPTYTKVMTITTPTEPRSLVPFSNPGQDLQTFFYTRSLTSILTSIQATLDSYFFTSGEINESDEVNQVGVTWTTEPTPQP